MGGVLSFPSASVAKILGCLDLWDNVSDTRMQNFQRNLKIGTITFRHLLAIAKHE